MKEIFQRLFFNQLYKKAYTRAVFTSFGIFIQEIKVSFSQFFTLRYPLSLFHVCRQVYLSVLRLMAGRSARISYAHTGEDRIIDSILKPIINKPGFYVEVGCNEPIFISNTFSLYKRGWKGICIDANGELIKKYKKKRPRDIAVQALVSNKLEERDYFIYTNNVLSSTEHITLNAVEEPGFELVEKQTMLTQSLTEILDKHNAPTQFDLLSVDAEEHDLQVLQSLDFNKYTPNLIVVESETIDSAKPSEDLIFQFITSKGYTFEGCILKNLYFSKH